MNRKKDKRINATSISVKMYLFFFFSLIFICGIYTNILTSYIQRGMPDDSRETLAMLAFLFTVSMIICLIFAFFKHRYIDRPIRRLREAAARIASGDFSIRVEPYRQDGKKDEMVILYEDFNTMVRELASTETLKTDFISSVSHEIKTPIAVIQNYASLLQSKSLSDKERMEYSRIVVQASQRLSGLVTDILRMNKLEHVEIASAGKPYALDEQLRRCALAFEELWSDKSITFSADLDEVTVAYDESLLELVWNNLISNAVKFTDPGGEITLTLSAEDGYAIAAVRDSGCGMDERTRLHIFDKFFQGDTSHSREGNGLGLAMVKRIINLLGGEILVESKAGTGSTFTVKLKT